MYAKVFGEWKQKLLPTYNHNLHKKQKDDNQDEEVAHRSSQGVDSSFGHLTLIILETGKGTDRAEQWSSSDGSKRLYFQSCCFTSQVRMHPDIQETLQNKLLLDRKLQPHLSRPFNSSDWTTTPPLFCQKRR